MNKIKIICIYVCFVVAVLSALMIITSPYPAEGARENTVNSASAQSNPAQIKQSFDLQLENDKIFLYSSDGKKTEIDYVDIYSLFDFQKEALKAGIHFNSAKDAAEYIQDLGS